MATKKKSRMRSKDVFKREKVKETLGSLPPGFLPKDKVIRIDGEVYEHIKQFAVPLKDTPNMVIRRLFGLDPALSDEDYKKTAVGQQL
jgi:hypothetical protein